MGRWDNTTGPLFTFPTNTMTIVDTNMKPLAINPAEIYQKAQVYVEDDSAYNPTFPVILRIEHSGIFKEIWISKDGAVQLMQALLKELAK